MTDTAANNTQKNPYQSQEKRLLDFLQRLQGNSGGTYGVLLHLSELRSSQRQPHFMRMVARSLETLSSQQDVQIFNFSNTDVVLLCRDTPVDEIDDAVFRIRALFYEDPLTQTEDGSTEDRFSSWYDLSQPKDFEELENTVAAVVAAHDNLRSKRTETMPSGRAAKAMDGEILTPEMVPDITQKLLEVRISDLVHRQPAVLVCAGKQQELAFREHYINMGELRTRIAPKINLFANHWLFQYLSQTLDARVLEVLSRLDYAQTDYPISINLNIATITARPFQNFHAIIAQHTGKIIIEIQIIDIFANMDAYFETRDWLQKRGYRVLIDGLNPLMLDFFDPTILGFDFIKIAWGPEIRGGVSEEKTLHIRNVVSKTKSGAVVLSRVDCEEGVSWGLTLGIRCFQGHFIDRVVDAMAQKGLLK